MQMKRWLMMVCCLFLMSACGSSAPNEESLSMNEMPKEPEVKMETITAGMDETLTTSFFEWTVKDAKVLSQLQNYVIDHGMKVLAVEVMIHNVMDEPIPMMDTDFQIQWGDDSESAYGWPISTCPEEELFMNQPHSDVPLSERQLACKYMLSADKTVIGLLYYEVPEDSSNYSISFKEYFQNGEYGETYAVLFSVE